MFTKGSSSRHTISSKITLMAVIMALIASSRLQADSGSCGGQTITLPFTDVMGSIFFCQIAELYVQGITNGTTPTTYSPNANVTRDQMAAFLSRTLDTGLRRGSKRAALDQFWTTTPHYDVGLGTTTLGAILGLVRSDGTYLCVASASLGEVYRVRASDGKLVDTWTGATSAHGVLFAMGRIFVTGNLSPAGNLYMIDPAAPPGVVATVTSALGQFSTALGFDGNKIWVANNNSLSIVTPGPTIPWSVTNVIGNFGRLNGFVFDGTNMWVTDRDNSMIKKLDSNGNVLQAVPVDSFPNLPGFDGKNIWVPCSNTMSVVRASTGEVVATLTGNGMSNPRIAAFDGERILVPNLAGDSVSLWKATDLTPLGTFAMGAGSQPFGACSDGKAFWIALRGSATLARF